MVGALLLPLAGYRRPLAWTFRHELLSRLGTGSFKCLMKGQIMSQFF
ncbi:hypothetical protein CLV58_10138 [Spirosoma oryzae]|uniref:Uncharacterized protein n=1 Tax=Spirosoma oryzae TaxID=1469603 RepID=A0A2T0TML9_9BACT|nr:hypothetical protein CLV58_10138 [Spirosoma oryzae]